MTDDKTIDSVINDFFEFKLQQLQDRIEEKESNKPSSSRDVYYWEKSLKELEREQGKMMKLKDEMVGFMERG